MRLAAAVGTALVLAGCGGAKHATLRIDEVELGSRHSIDGSLWHLRVARGSTVVLDRKLRTRHVELRVEPGRYAIASEQLPCDGNCGTLDPPAEQCRSELDVRAGDTPQVVVRLQPGTGCAVWLHPIE